MWGVGDMLFWKSENHPAGNFRFVTSGTIKRGNFDRQGNFDRSGSFVKDATVLNREHIFVASAFMEMNDSCSGLHIYMLLRPCLHHSNLKTSWKFGISQKNWPFLKQCLNTEWHLTDNYFWVIKVKECLIGLELWVWIF